MNQEIKTKWLEALRSGDYTQTTNHLKDDKGYCCLGVLCDLHRKETGYDWKVITHSSAFDYYGISGSLPPEVIAWAVMEGDHNPAVPVPEGLIITTCPDGKTSLAELNDVAKYDFRQIANVIEEEL